MPHQLSSSCPAVRPLLLLSRMVNQTVGDALSMVLLVELVLRWERGEGQDVDGRRGG